MGRNAQNAVVAKLRVTGSTGAILGDVWNIATVVRNGAGDYTITYDEDIDATATAYALAPIVSGATSERFHRLTIAVNGSCQVLFENSSGTAIDTDFTFLAIGRPAVMPTT